MDGVRGIRLTNLGQIPIADLDFAFFAKKGHFVPGNTEDYVEGFANDMFTASTHYTEDPMSCGWKVFHSDGFHMSKYFTILTEHKRGNLQDSISLIRAICQAIYYYWYSLRIHKGDDKLRYICICDASSTYIIKVDSIKETINTIFRILDNLNRNGALQGKGKITACTISKVHEVFDAVYKIMNRDIIKIYSYRDFSDGILWMFNEWEKDFPEELENIINGNND